MAEKEELSAEEKYGRDLCKYAWRGNVKRVKRCIRKGGSVEYQNPLSLARPLHRACLGGSLETVEYLVSEANANLDAKDEEEWTPLHYAASKGFVSIIEFLASKGAPLDALDIVGNTPLHHAAIKGQTDAVEALLRLGARSDILNEDEQTAAQVCSPKPQIQRLFGITVTETDMSSLVKIKPKKDNDLVSKYFDAIPMYDLIFTSEEDTETDMDGE